MARRHSSGGWGVLGALMLLGLVIQVVKLLVVPLTILAIGAVVIVPIYLVTKHGKVEKVNPPPRPAAAPEPEPVDDGIVSQDAVLRFLPPDVVRAVTQGEQPGTTAAEIWPAAYRHGSCPVSHRTYEAAARCRRG
jgi:hypothetical protein